MPRKVFQISLKCLVKKKKDSFVNHCHCKNAIQSWNLSIRTHKLTYLPTTRAIKMNYLNLLPWYKLSRPSLLLISTKEINIYTSVTFTILSACPNRNTVCHTTCDIAFILLLNKTIVSKRYEFFMYPQTTPPEAMINPQTTASFYIVSSSCRINALACMERNVFNWVPRKCEVICTVVHVAYRLSSGKTLKSI